MKLVLDQSPSNGETKVVVRCSTVGGRLSRVLGQIQALDITIPAVKGGSRVDVAPRTSTTLSSTTERPFSTVRTGS